MLFEGRTSKETHGLGKELWDMISTYTNELVINQRGLVNPEHVCEALLKICNDFFSSWSQKYPIEKWGELSMVIAVSTPLAIYFTRVGEARILLFRNRQIIIADENLTHPRSPQFSPPFSEIAGGPLNLGDRFLVASPEIISSFSFEELSSLAAPSGLIGAYQNLLRSIELLTPPKNTAFVLGGLISTERPDSELVPMPLKEWLKEARIGELNFVEFNATAPQVAAAPKISAPIIPWQKIILAAGGSIFNLFKLIFKILGFIVKPISRKIGSLSLARRIILFLGLGLFIIYLVLVGRSLVNRPGPEIVKTDYEAIYNQAAQLKVEAESALIYQDEEKARTNLAQADNLLAQAANSGDWGIKALKLRQEVADELATLDKAELSQVNKLWTVPQNKGDVKNIYLTSNKGAYALTSQTIFALKASGDVFEGEELGKAINLGPEKSWLALASSDLLSITPKSKSFFTLNSQNREISDKKDLPQEVNNASSAVGTFDSAVYFFDPAENQIKLFSFQNGNITFSRNWLKDESKGEFQDDPAVGLSIDGSIFAATKSGKILKLSGGKKSAWNVEKPSVSFQGDQLQITTKPEYVNLYLLDPANKRVVIFAKDSGKLLGQVQNAALGQAVDFQVDEKEKTVYFATPGALFKVKFEF